jgi:hypothetical protein
MRFWQALVLAGLGLLGISGCHRHRMTADECGLLLDRIVELELIERGFRDPLLAKRRQAEIRMRLSPELTTCEGRRATPNVMTCVRQAQTAEEISHVCLW